MAASKVTQAEILKVRARTALRSAEQAGGASQFQSKHHGVILSLAWIENNIATFCVSYRLLTDIAISVRVPKITV
jgi:hypothetical protein